MTTRRRFLQGLGLGMAAPLLYPLVRQVVAEDSATTPRRFVFFVEGNGVEPNTLLSDAARAALESNTGAQLAGERYLFKRYKHQDVQEIQSPGLDTAIALDGLRGRDGELDLRPESVALLGLSSKITGGGHETNFGALSSSFAPKIPTHATIDHHLSLLPRVRQRTIFDVVRLSVGGRGVVAYDTCSRGPGEVAPMIIDPATAFDKLFGWMAAGNRAKTFAQKRRLLDLARLDADRAVRAFQGANTEYEKLQRYLAGINTLIQQHDELSARKELCDSRGGCDFAPLEPGADGALYSSTCPIEQMSAQTDLAISALVGQLTNVVVLGMGTGGRWGGTYASLRDMFPRRELTGRHDVCHTSTDPAMLAILHEVNRQNVNMVARIARALAAEEEPGSPGDSMLDHTVIVFMSDNGEKHHSEASEWPVLLIGGKKMGLVTGGRTLVYPRIGEDKNRRMSDLYTTLDNLSGGVLDLDPMQGQARTTFGAEGDSRLIKGPLPELMV